jgi:predicted MFS family arabinose efflux permease
VVVGFQAAIMIAAGVGGFLVDNVGVELVYAVGVVALITGALLFGASNRRGAKTMQARGLGGSSATPMV